MPEHAPPSRVLLIRPSALGDVCRSVPVLVSLKRAFPDAEIDWLVQASFADAVAAHPSLREPIPFHRGKLTKPSTWSEALSLRRRLREGRYDLVVDAQGLLRSGFFAGATRAPRRIGYADAREHAALFYNEPHKVDPKLHAVDRMLALVAAAGIEPVADMRLYTRERTRRKLWERHAELERGGHVVIAPTSRWAAKRWPIDRFRDLAQRLLAEGARRIAVVGAPGEAEQCAPLLGLAKNDPRILDLVGDLSVGELMATVENSALVVANDSAPLHMAVGFGRPTVALFGPTRTELVGPYKRDADVIQHVEPGDDFRHKLDANAKVMERIAVGEVLAACRYRLA